MRKAIVAVVLVSAVTMPSLAWADGPSFGGTGQLVISDDQSLASTYVGSNGSGPYPMAPGANSTVSFEYVSVNNVGTGAEFTLAPAADYFVMDRLSVGGEIIFGVDAFASQSSPSVLFGFAPRVGYTIPISDNLTFWPKLFVGYATVSSNAGWSANAFDIGVFAPVLFHVAPHLFVGGGPNLSTVLSSNASFTTTTGTMAGATQTQTQSFSPNVTEIGLQATFGGWLSLGSL